MITTVLAMATSTAAGSVEAIGLVDSTSFGVGRTFAVLFVVFVFLLGAMFLGGHLGGASRRRRDKRRKKRH